MVPSHWRATFRKAHFFDRLDVGDAVEYETALQLTHCDIRLRRRAARGRARRQIDPGDLRDWPAIPGVNVLTIRNGGDGQVPWYLIHSREGEAVALSGGVKHVTPAGVFQPHDDEPESFRRDCDFWMTAVREYAEEFLGVPEAAVQQNPDFLEREPYRDIIGAEEAGDIVFRVLGFGIDPLSLAFEVLCVAVFSPQCFDGLFGHRVTVLNREGRILAAARETVRDPKGREKEVVRLGFPFAADAIAEQLGYHDFLPAGSAALLLAWKHREDLKIISGPSM